MALLAFTHHLNLAESIDHSQTATDLTCRVKYSTGWYGSLDLTRYFETEHRIARPLSVSEGSPTHKNGCTDFEISAF